MHYVYVLKCNNDDLYVGSTADLRKRIGRHFEGNVKSTKGKKPLKLIYYEAYADKRDSTRRERQLKMHKAKSDLKKQMKYTLGIEGGTVAKW